MIRRPPKFPPLYSSAASDVYKRQTSCCTDYLDIMALALANADIPLDEKSSLDFLAQNGYIERRRLNTINEVIRKAEKMKFN